ncbi:MAG: efflux RND transporter periplasmic adaptor subunit, partial [Gammaproteobacteria bacterium]|nr:efflux RND transporter periplasmic adaptor subunit [Gammaproteobacteria bacterium]
IIPTADRQKATVKVRIGFLERDERVLRDMGVKVAFLGANIPADPSQDAGGVLIAGEALRSDASGDFVWLVRDGQVEKRAIRIGGQKDQTQIFVTNGLRLGDTIVRSSESPLVAGQSVKTK